MKQTVKSASQETRSCCTKEHILSNNKRYAVIEYNTRPWPGPGGIYRRPYLGSIGYSCQRHPCLRS